MGIATVTLVAGGDAASGALPRVTINDIDVTNAITVQC